MPQHHKQTLSFSPLLHPSLQTTQSPISLRFNVIRCLLPKHLHNIIPTQGAQPSFSSVITSSSFLLIVSICYSFVFYRHSRPIPMQRGTAMQLGHTTHKSLTGASVISADINRASIKQVLLYQSFNGLAFSYTPPVNVCRSRIDPLKLCRSGFPWNPIDRF